eukprot:gene1214-1376_t
MGAADTAVLLQQGYDQGLFVEGSQIIVTSFANTNDTWGSLSPPSIANVLMKGIISVEPAINMSDPHTINFVKRYRSLPPSVIVDKSSNKQTCVNTTDGDRNTYIYKIYVDGGYKCVGISNFSALNPDGSDIPYEAYFAYDTVFTAMRASLLFAEAGHAFPPRGIDFINFMAQTTVIDFHGVTGYIDISPGYPQYGGFGLGDRDMGIFFKVVNYQVCTDGATGRMYPCLRTIGTWESESGYRPCSKRMYADCVDPVFSTADNSIPLDWPLPIYKYMGPGVVGFMLFMGIVAALVSLVFLVIVFWYAKTPVIKASHST